MSEFRPIYDMKKSYLENAEEGPFFSSSFPERKAPHHRFTFLGHEVSSKIGVPAGPLLNSRWVEFAAKMGFDILTYKTIRSRFHPSHPVPNVIYVDCPQKLKVTDEGGILYAKDQECKSIEDLAITNSFGIPSREPDYVVQDIDKAKRCLKKGQVLIVSFVGTPCEEEDFAQDFVKAAHLAQEGGAEILEADFSCPNVKSCEGSVHKNPESVFTISKAIKKAIPQLPLIIKLGVIENPSLLEEVMLAASRAGVEAICGINTMSMQVLNREKLPALGPNRLRSGVCGSPIRNVALEFVKQALHVKKKNNLDLLILGTGGITQPSHFDHFFEAGADVAMSAAGMLFNPYLAARYHEGR